MPTDNTQSRESAARHRWIALAVVTLAAFLDNLDANAVTVVLPDIQKDLGAAFGTAQWTLAGYTLAYALFLITGGRLGDIYGRKRLFLTGVAGFTAASVVCALATSGEMLVTGRFGQGFMAALMVPQAVSVIITMFKQSEWPSAFAVMGIALSVGSVGGPLLGGLLAEWDVAGLGWRALFWVNVPLGVAAIAIAARFMPETRSETPLRLDLLGVLLLTTASLGLMFPLVQGREQGWPAWMLLLVAFALVVLAVFVVQQRRRHAKDGAALVPPTLFKYRSATVGLPLTLLCYAGVASFFLVLTFHLQMGLGWPVLKTALVLAAWPVGIIATFQIAWRFSTGRGHDFVRGGALLLALGAGGVIWTVLAGGGDVNWVPLAASELVMGFGLGLTAPVLTAVVLGDVPPQDAGVGSGVLNAAIQFGSAAGVAGVGAVYFSQFTEATARADYAGKTASALAVNVGLFVLTAVLATFLKTATAAKPQETPAAADPAPAPAAAPDGPAPEAAQAGKPAAALTT
ncbi:MFS transporter [Streptomyces sp. ODS05-4]|uniref:MFS transporter n=1 Tax=Streptomyces sp. ODS05-4 TaxID=2944939 RepID=UPI00210C4851|nr:MFS transporter [Streptomyces sp. ODS05-4]